MGLTATWADGEAAEHWAQVLAAITTSALSLYLIWGVYMSEDERRALARWARTQFRWWHDFKSRRSIQSRMTFETFLVQDALEDYNGGRDLQEALACP